MKRLRPCQVHAEGVRAVNNGLKRMGFSLILGMLTLVITLIGTAAHAGATVPQHTEAPLHSSTYDDIQWLRGIIEGLAEEEVRLSASNYGLLYDPTIVPDKLLVGLLLALPGESKLEQHEHSWTAAKLLSDQTVLYASVKQEAESTVVVMQLHSTMLEANESYARWFTTLDQAWERLGLDANWRVNLQATLSTERTSEDVWAMLQHEGAGEEPIGEYREGGTVSRTYKAPFMFASVTADAQTVRLQAAVHQSSEDHSYRVTLGSPLITIEY